MSQMFSLIFILFFANQLAAQSETYYKYVDENGTVVITQNLSDVPEDQRDAMEEVNFFKKESAREDEKTSFEIDAVGEKQNAALKAFVTEENIKAMGEKGVREGKARFSSFIKDQKTALILYAVVGLVGFLLISKLLKRFIGGFVTKIVMKLGIIVVIFSGVYLLYLSWLSKTVLNFNQSGDLEAQSLSDQITTPREILQQTQEAVDQFNKSAAEREALLNGMDGR